MKKLIYLTLCALLVVLSSCRRDDDCLRTELEPLISNLIPGSPNRFSGKLYVYGLDYIDPLDIDVNYYRVEFKDSEVIYVPWQEFLITRDSSIKNCLGFDITGPNIQSYTGRPSSSIRSITIQCKLRPRDYLTQQVKKQFN